MVFDGLPKSLSKRVTLWIYHFVMKCVVILKLFGNAFKIERKRIWAFSHMNTSEQLLNTLYNIREIRLQPGLCCKSKSFFPAQSSLSSFQGIEKASFINTSKVVHCQSLTIMSISLKLILILVSQFVKNCRQVQRRLLHYSMTII